MQYHGQMALQIGILVAFTQLIPEHHVQVLGIIKCRVKVRLHTLYPHTQRTKRVNRLSRWPM